MRAAIASLPPREQKVIGLYYYGEATMKQIGAEIGVNESRVSQLHARAIRRLRDALATMLPAAEAAKVMRSAILEFQKPQMAKATLESRSSVNDGVQPAGCGCELRERVAHAAQQVAEPERLGEPAAAALFEKALGVGAGHVAGDEDDAPRQRRRRGRDRAVKRHPVDARHLQIADDHVVGTLTHAGEGFLAVARVVNLKPASISASPTASGERSFILDQQHRRAPCSRRSMQTDAAAWAAIPPLLTGNSTVNEAPPSGDDSTRMLPPCSWTMA